MAPVPPTMISPPATPPYTFVTPLPVKITPDAVPPPMIVVLPPPPRMDSRPTFATRRSLPLAEPNSLSPAPPPVRVVLLPLAPCDTKMLLPWLPPV